MVLGKGNMTENDRGTNVEIALSREAFRKLSEAIWTSSGDSGVHLHLEIRATHTFSPKKQSWSKEYSKFAPPACPSHKRDSNSHVIHSTKLHRNTQVNKALL